MRVAIAVVALLVVAPGALSEEARDGVLDPTYGLGGIALHSAARGGTVALGRAYDAVPLADGKLLLVGVGSRLDGGMHATEEPVVVRLNADGSLDTGYGEGGVAVFPLGAPMASRGGTARAAAMLGDGRLLVVGLIREDDGLTYRRCQLVFALDATGNIDPGYGPGPGPECTYFGYPAPPPGSAGALYDVVGLATAAADGKAFISGPVTVNAPGSVIARLDAQGRFDQEFSGVGRVFLDTSTTVGLYSNSGLTALADGGVLVAASRSSSGVRSRGVLRLDADGAPVAGFGVGGFAGAALAGQIGLELGLDVDANGAPVVAGLSRFLPLSQPDQCNYCVLRFTALGLPDPDFNSQGVHAGVAGTAEITYPIGAWSGSVQAIRLRNGGKLLLAGTSQAPTPSNGYLVGMVSLLEDGRYDPRFGDPTTPGRQQLSPAGIDAADSIPWDIVVLPGKRAIVVGYFSSFSGKQPQRGMFALRLQDDALLVDSFDAP